MLMLGLYPFLSYFLVIFASPPGRNLPDYQYGYHVHDERTGDYKTQSETRDGDSVKGNYTVGEPNGDLRVVTYEADKNSGFNAKVQIQPGGVKLMNDAYNRQKIVDLMRSIPRQQTRTGFPQLEIKILPPLSQPVYNQPVFEETLNTSPMETPSKVENSPTTIEPQTSETTTENNEQKTNASIDEILFQLKEPPPTEIPEELPTEKTEIMEAEKPVSDEALQNQSKNFEEHLCKVICNKQRETMEEEARAHIKPNQDKVQVEMEQIIRAEMQEPTAVNLGVPYQQFLQSEIQSYGKPHHPSIQNADNQQTQHPQHVMKFHFNHNQPSTTPKIDNNREGIQTHQTKPILPYYEQNYPVKHMMPPHYGYNYPPKPLMPYHYDHNYPPTEPNGNIRDKGQNDSTKYGLHPPTQNHHNYRPTKPKDDPQEQIYPTKNVKPLHYHTYPPTLPGYEQQKENDSSKHGMQPSNQFNKNYEPQGPPEMMPPPYYQSKVILLPFKINSNDYLTLKPQYASTYPQFLNSEQQKLVQQANESDPNKSVHNPSYNMQPNNQDPKLARVYPLYTTGLAFVVIPRL